MSEEVERTLCQLPQAHVFKIPAIKSAEGHRAADWPKDPIWTGKLKIVAKGRVAIISLIDDKNAVFASCPVTDDSCVERTLDSGRYFVLKIQNAQGKHAFIGLAFNERNDAFDFNVALSEHKAECEREDNATTAAVEVPLRDLSLKEGEKIKIKIGSGLKKEKKQGDSTTASGGFRLAPPGGAKPVLLAPPSADRIPSSAFSSITPKASDILSTPAHAAPVADSTVFGFSSSQGLATPQGFDDFSSSFGSSDPFSQTPSLSFAATDPFGFPMSTATTASVVMKPQDTQITGSVNLLDL